MSKEFHLKALGARIKALRSERDLTQEDLAERARLHSRYISRVELGGANFGVAVLFQLARGLDVHPAFLLSGLPVENVSPPVSTKRVKQRDAKP